MTTGRRMAGVALIFPDTGRVTVTLRPTATFKGYVVDPDGRPIPDFRVILGPFANESQIKAATDKIVTDSSGWFTAPHILPGGTYRIRWTTQDEFPCNGVRFDSGTIKPDQPIRIVVPRDK